MATNIPKISIVIPCYNQEKYIEECVRSVLQQTFQDYEVVLIDDGCSDKTFSIVKKMVKDDERYHIIKFEKNKGTSQARKEGVLVSKGKYVVFLDPDDMLVQNALNIMYESALNKKVDILQFGTNVINCGADDFVCYYFDKKCLPYKKRLINKNIFFACFEKRLFNFNLWNKVYDGNLIRHAFSLVKDGYYTIGEDAYAFAIISYFAKSYDYINDNLYNYNFGRGITGNIQGIKIDRFLNITTQMRVVELLYKFVDNQSPKDYKRYMDVLDDMFNKFYIGVCKNYQNIDDFENNKNQAEKWILESITPKYNKNEYKNEKIYTGYEKNTLSAKNRLGKELKVVPQKSKRKSKLLLPFRAFKLFIKRWTVVGFKDACKDIKIGVEFALKKKSK